MAVEGIEGKFTKHLGTLQEQIDKADVIKAEKMAAQGTATETLDAAKAKESASEQGLKDAAEALTSLQAQHKESYRKTESTSKFAMEAITEHGVKQESLAKAKQVLSTFTELFERKTPVPSMVDETMDKVEDVPQPAMCQPSPMRSLQVA